MATENNIHLLSLFINGIKLLGVECVEQAINHLIEHKSSTQPISDQVKADCKSANLQALSNHSADELRGMLVNLIKIHFGEEAKAIPNGPCCPSGSCCVCVNGVPLFC